MLLALLMQLQQTLAPLDHPGAGPGLRARVQPVSLYYQVRSETARATAKTTIALYLLDNGVARDSAALQVGFDQALHSGINEVAPTIDVSRLDKGTYRLEVRLTDDQGAVLTRRVVQLNLH